MGISDILMLLIFVLIMVIIVLALIYFKMSMDEKNGKSSKKANKNTKGKQEKQNNAQSYTKQSVFSFMEFEKIEDNMIVQKKGKRYLMVVECQGINYDLMSRVEKNAVEDGFSQFLNMLRHPIQIYTQSRTINLESSIQNYKQRVDSIKSELEKKENNYKQMVQSGKYSQEELQKFEFEITKERNLYEYGKDIIFNTERMSSNKNVLRKQYYIVVPYYSEENNNELFGQEEIRNIAFSELYTKAQSIIRTLSACGIIGKVLDSFELVDLLYNAYNRDEAEIYGMKKAIQGGYDELYVTAQDIIDKKIEALNQKIEEEALERAKNAVFEVKSEKEKELEYKEKTLEDLISEMADEIIEQNKTYIGEDIAKEAKKKVRTKEKEAENGKTKRTRTTTRRKA